MAESHDCPNCGASLRLEGLGDVVRCTFCGTEVVVPRPRRSPTRSELEEERTQLLQRETEWDQRLERTRTRGAEDFIIPPIGCCGIYVALFVICSAILIAIGLKESREHRAAVAAIAISASVIGTALIVWHREKRRRDLLAALEREWESDREVRRRRLREIAGELGESAD